jgi:hypothetical protein
MKPFTLSFGEAASFYQLTSDLILFRPIMSKLFRTCYIPERYKSNEEFIQVCNTLSVNKKPIKGVYYFKVTSFEDFENLSMTFFHMGVEHIFAEPNVNPIGELNSQLN